MMKNGLLESNVLRRVLGFIIFISLSLMAITLLGAEQEPWQVLFDGKSLEGWTQRGGKAIYQVVENQIVGTTVLNTPNSFLCTNNPYGDFILELEFKGAPNLNSGIQIRSRSVPEYQNGQVHGYQVEIDPSERGWTGGIYDEARRGWLYTLEKNPSAQKAFQEGQWNHLRIEAIGDNLKTWLNSVPAANLEDDQTRQGFIALQVHSVGSKNELEGLKVHWRNIRIIQQDAARFAWKSPLPRENMYNRLTSNEEKEGWKLLFDGKTTAGWRGAKQSGFPEFGWEVKEGALTVLESGGGESRHGGDIVTLEKFSQFELSVDFKLTPGANSGIKYYVNAELNKGEGSAIGLEYQLLDDDHHPDAKLGRIPGIRTLASLYDLIKAENREPRPVGEWSHARIVSRGPRVEHWLNGRKVLEYERGGAEYRRLVAGSKYKVFPDFGELESGPILLQDHGNRVSFRNLRIRNLAPAPSK
jgi:hypothetical protein